MAYRPIFYDTETTGIKPDRDKIIEIAAYDPVKEVSFCKLINPQCPIPEEAQKIHKISDEMVKDAPFFGEVAKEFITFCEGEVVLIAHNNDAFDKPFLECEFKNSGLAFPNWRFLDSLKWARKYRTDLPRHALQFLREVYGFEQNQAHRALDDVITLHRVFMAMVDDLSFETIFSLLDPSAPLSHMPFGKYQGHLLKDVPKDYLQWLGKSGALDKKENASLKSSIEKLGLLTV
jgi:DNA polymerase III subunit epsilon